MSHLTSTTSHDLPGRPDLAAVVDRATGLLKELAEPHDHLNVAADWSTMRDSRDELKLVLRLRDAHAEAVEAFTPAELAAPDARSLLSRVYRTLLGERVRRLLAASGPSAVGG